MTLNVHKLVEQKIPLKCDIEAITDSKRLIEL
jgi:hypothetical protein